MAELVIRDGSGVAHVFLDQSGDDHIVTRLGQKKSGEEFDAMLGHGTPAWERAVERAWRAAAFV